MNDKIRKALLDQGGKLLKVAECLQTGNVKGAIRYIDTVIRPKLVEIDKALEDKP